MMHPLHTPEFVCQSIQQTGNYFDSKRKTGRTTADALGAISAAIRNPRTEIALHDHTGTPLGRSLLAEVIIPRMVRQLELAEMYIKGGCLTFGIPARGGAGWELIWPEQTPAPKFPKGAHPHE